MAGRRENGAEPPLRGQMGHHLGHGLAWALGMILFMFLGWLLDGWLGTVPLFTIVGAFIGAGAGLYNLYYRVIVQPRERDKNEEDGPSS